LESTVLDQILVARRRRLDEARARVPLGDLQRAAEARSDRRDFTEALRGPALRVIAELKRASPSRGVLRTDFRPAEIARGYEAAGAAALSVLTEEDYFAGSLADLQQARAAVALPVLRKDFIIEDYQVYEAAAAGADAVLLIVAALGASELPRLIELSQSLKLAALVEVHTEEELQRALDAGARIVGVNNRNLKTLQVGLETSFRLREKIPATCLVVSESGIRTADDLKRLSAAGFDAVLIGERFMTEPDPASALAELLYLASGAPRVGI
jgi:indole-3-glycerol phosphate synthase